MKADFSIEGKIAVISGGLGQLGSAYCRTLAEAGAHVACLDLPSEASPGPGIAPENWLYCRADITKRTDLETALAEVESRWGTPEILINNAALDSPPGAAASENGPVEDVPEEAWDRVMDVNLKGVFLTCQVFGGAMARAGRGSVINIGSIYGVVSPDQRIYAYKEAQEGKPFFKPAAYSASKSGLYNLTRYLATYWASSGVRVNILTLAGIFDNQDESFLKGYLPKVPLGRMAAPSDYSGPLIFLSSDASAYMTGTELRIDGGYTAW
jgi:NAD(P)-dependent dehydrogenase (short-subunit alcohol dehydrogenase family)